MLEFLLIAIVVSLVAIVMLVVDVHRRDNGMGLQAG